MSRIIDDCIRTEEESKRILKGEYRCSEGTGSPIEYPKGPTFDDSNLFISYPLTNSEFQPFQPLLNGTVQFAYTEIHLEQMKKTLNNLKTVEELQKKELDALIQQQKQQKKYNMSNYSNIIEIINDIRVLDIPNDIPEDLREFIEDLANRFQFDLVSCLLLILGLLITSTCGRFMVKVSEDWKEALVILFANCQTIGFYEKLTI